MINALAHTCYIVNDLDAALDFYCNKLDLPIAFDFRNEQGQRFGAYLHLGGRSFIELFAGEVGERAAKQSYGHCSLEVDDIKATVAKLRERGVTVGDISMGGDNSWQAWLNDPDGNAIELHQYTPESWQVAALKRFGVMSTGQ